MKKFFGLMIAAMFSLSSFVSAESVLDGLKLSGEITVNKTSVNNEATLSSDGDDYRSESTVRTMINIDGEVADGVKGRVVLTKNDQKFGDAGNTDQSLTGVQGAVNVSNAYIQVEKLFDLVDLKVGRMFYGDKGNLAVYYGPGYDYGLGITAIDGYLATAEISGINVKYLDAKVLEAGAPATDNDNDLQGLVLTPQSKIADMIAGEFYYYKSVNGAGGSTHDQDTLLIYGVKANAEVSGVNVKAEYAMNGGTDETGATDDDYAGSAMVLGASMKVSGLNVRAEIAQGTGDKASTADKDEDFASAGDLSYGEVWGNSPAGPFAVGGAGIQDLNVMNIGVDYDVNDKVSSSADYLIFTENEAAAGTKDDIGSEIDLKATYTHSESVSLDLVVARFMSGDAWKAVVDPPADIDKVNLQMNVKF